MKQLLRILTADLGSGFRPRFWVAVALIPALILADNFADLIGVLERPSIYYFHFYSITYGGLCGTYLVGMMCALPYANAFIDEWSGNMAGAVMVRCGRNNYFASKVISCCLLGGLANLLGQALLFVVLRYMVGLSWFDAYDVMLFYESSGQMYFVIALYYAFLNGALMAGFAMCVSAYAKNTYAVLVSPAVFRFVYIQANRLLGVPIKWQVNQWLSMRAAIWSEGATMILGLCAVVVMLVVMSCFFAFRGKRVMDGA